MADETPELGEYADSNFWVTIARDLGVYEEGTFIHVNNDQKVGCGKCIDTTTLFRLQCKMCS